jgi:serine/threonine-protein kinase RsbW
MTELRILPDPAPWPASPLDDRTWASQVDRKQDVIDAIVGLLDHAGMINDLDRPWLLMCLDEAVVNAMLHGNEGDPAVPIRVAVAVHGDRWQVWIRDQGGGFAASDVPDPEDPASLLLEHGRGIRLMASWLDELVWYDRGSTIAMTRRRSTPTP